MRTVPSGVLHELLWTLVIIASGATTALMTVRDVDSPIRLLVTLWFLFACPGMAIVRLLGIVEPLLAWTIAVSVSAALAGLTAQLFLYFGAWSPVLQLATLLAVSTCAVGTALVRSWQRLPRTRPAELERIP